ncbi:unnamed protein product [Phaedon cochleariae]|uniref:RING-type E3 ubiquitin transferase n=1 Tax=Phaedon cochleariae TaxID=80249 RepID=A0A9P0DIX6_PHACE|nr:unnamed protein product [Phaedon cochleariae]
MDVDSDNTVVIENSSNSAPQQESEHSSADDVEFIDVIPNASPTVSISEEPKVDEHNDEVSQKSQTNENSANNYEEDGALCPICFDSWTNTGDHRICALKCGHLFGYNCINRWLDSQQKRSCPTCKKKVNKTDIRFIYAKKLVAVDTSEIDMMKNQLDLLIEEKNKMSLELSKYVCREHVLNQEILDLRRHIQVLSTNSRVDQQPSHNNRTSATTSSVRLFMDKSLEICRQNSSRVFDTSAALDLIVASAKSPNNLFSGFGIRKFNMSQYRPLAFIPLHNQQIRDISFHPMNNNCVLTASMDKSFKVIDTVSNTVTFTTSQAMPLWSCCWDRDNPYMLYIGTQSGDVVKYDVRVATNSVCTFSVPGDMSPVVSVASVPLQPGNHLVISCKLNSIWIFQNNGSNSESDVHRHSLAVEGPFVSMKYNSDIQQLLISSRPNNRIPYSRHSLCTLEKTSTEQIYCNLIHSFQGGGMQKLLSKSCFVRDQQEYVAAYQESSKCVHLWSINTGQRIHSIPAHDAVLDLGGVQTQSGNFLVSLTEKKLEFFKFN